MNGEECRPAWGHPDIVVLALPGEYLLLLVIYRHHINLRIAVDAARPVRTDAGGHEVNCFVPTQRGKDILTDVLVGEGNDFLDIPAKTENNCDGK